MVLFRKSHSLREVTVLLNESGSIARRHTHCARAPMAQLAEATDLKSVCCRFESDWGYHGALTRNIVRANAPIRERTSVG